jgi:branched-chain amino acid transport system ATP-binding protein
LAKTDKWRHPLLQVAGVDVFFGTSQVLFALGLEVCQGEIVSLLGRNGMGKTTTVRAIMGLHPAKKGSIQFKGYEIRSWPAYRIAQQGIGLVPEGRQVFPTLTVRENLLATAANRQGRQPAWTLQAIYALFPVLAQRRNHLGSQLSGGEQQMLAIGRALMTNPQLLILDEATEGLAPKIRMHIWDSLQNLKETGLSIFIIDKNVDALTRICDRHFIIEKGRIVWHGASEAFKKNAAIQHQYLGV